MILNQTQILQLKNLDAEEFLSQTIISLILYSKDKGLSQDLENSLTNSLIQDEFYKCLQIIRDQKIESIFNEKSN